MKNLKLLKTVSLGLIFYSHSTLAVEFTRTFSCSPFGKSGAEVTKIVIVGTEPKEATETILVSATVEKIKIGKTAYKQLTFKGERPYSARGPYYELTPDPLHKKIKSIFISAKPSGQEVGQDELIMANEFSHKMSCNEQ